MIVLWPCIPLAFKPWPAYSQPIRHRARAGSMYPRARLRVPSPSHVQLRHQTQTRRVAQVMWRQQVLPRGPLLDPPLQLSLPLRPCRALKMYAACRCPHTIQLPQVAANALRQHQVLSFLLQPTVLRPRGHDKRSTGTVGSCVRALARKSYKSLTTGTNAYSAQDSLRLMAHSRPANAKILLVYFLCLHLSRVLGYHYWLTQL